MFCHIVGDGRANECLESRVINLVPLIDDYGAGSVAVEVGVEDSLWVLERSSLGEGQPQMVFVGLASADDPVV